MNKGYVYLIMEVNEHGAETYKIGVTKRCVHIRLRELQTGNSSKLSLMKFYTSENYLKVERWLHRKYQIKTQAENEWRSLTDEQVFSFLEDCKKADETISFLLKENPFYK